MHPADTIAGYAPDALKELNALLINVPLRASAPPNCAPMGPALLAARLRQYGAKVTVIDLNAYRLPDLRDGLKHISELAAANHIFDHVQKYGTPHLVGLSGKITTLRWQKFIAELISNYLPDALLVSGGGLATEFREGLFNWIPQLDAVCHSEGDDVIIEIGKDALDPHKKVLHHVYAGDRPRDLDKTPMPAWDLWNEDVYGEDLLTKYLENPIWGLEANNSSATPFKMKRSLNTISSRGCSYACNFCFKGAQGERNYGVRSANVIAEEIAHYHERYGVDFVALLDDNCMIDAGRMKDFVDTVGAVCKVTGVRWGTHGRLDEAADLRPGHGPLPKEERRVELMSKAGCIYIGFGAESASEKVLHAMGKGGFMLANGTERIYGRDLPRTMLEGYRNTIEAGIHGNCTWISGYPTEKLKDLQDSITFILWQRELIQNKDAVSAKLFCAQAYPGTELFKHPKVKAILAEGFGISFDSAGEPICDDALEAYVLELDDAKKVLTDKFGKPVYYGDMTMVQFEKCRTLIDEGRISEILNL